MQFISEDVMTPGKEVAVRSPSQLWQHQGAIWRTSYQLQAAAEAEAQIVDPCQVESHCYLSKVPGRTFHCPQMINPTLVALPTSKLMQDLHPQRYGDVHAGFRRRYRAARHQKSLWK